MYRNRQIILTLLNIPRVSRKTVNKILDLGLEMTLENEKIIHIFQAARATNKRVIVPEAKDIESAKIKAMKIIKDSEEQNIGIITILDDDFPDKLKKIDDNPVIIFYKGNKNCLYKDNSVSLIGTRNPTEHGIKVAKRLGYLFGNNNFVVVSGLAKGCDEYAHKGCIEAKGETIAVLPCGLDKVYPVSNKVLANDILNNNGCLISEYQIGQKISKNLFIERDRLQSALSKGIVVIESSLNSGTLHTAEYAQKQNKLLACYKHRSKYEMHEQAKGNEMLINEKGAFKIFDESSINEFKNKLTKVKTNYNSSSDTTELQLRFDI